MAIASTEATSELKNNTDKTVVYQVPHEVGSRTDQDVVKSWSLTF